jgi:hypothetical protein
MKVGRLLACFAVGLAVNVCVFLAGFTGSVLVAVALPVTSGLTGLMLYWNEDKSFKRRA